MNEFIFFNEHNVQFFVLTRGVAVDLQSSFETHSVLSPPPAFVTRSTRSVLLVGNRRWSWVNSYNSSILGFFLLVGRDIVEYSFVHTRKYASRD